MHGCPTRAHARRHGRPTRKIIHIDVDAFYASVEQRGNPDLRGKRPNAACVPCRKFGVRSAMWSITAKRQRPDLISRGVPLLPDLAAQGPLLLSSRPRKGLQVSPTHSQTSRTTSSA
ncbi:hypothetical protein IVA73_26340 [Bradyrhizobium sp. 131]|nr:hypothetical protein IVA73_26340 [Bradyrhizobium sp. 131]